MWVRSGGGVGSFGRGGFVQVSCSFVEGCVALLK